MPSGNTANFFIIFTRAWFGFAEPEASASADMADRKQRANLTTVFFFSGANATGGLISPLCPKYPCGWRYFRKEMRLFAFNVKIVLKYESYLVRK